MLKYFLVPNNRTIFGFKVWWSSLGVMSRLRGKNKAMAYLLRRPKRRVFFKLGRFSVVWQPKRFGASSSGVPLPNPPQFSNKTITKTIVHDLSQLKPTKVVFDDRPTEVVLDELCKNRNNER